MIRAHVFIEGRVQGVFYRAWARDSAIDFGLTGWVRNLEDGRVELVAEGEKGQLKKLIELIKKGPPLAKVEHLDVVWEKATRRRQGYGGQAGGFEGFEIVF